MKHISDSKERQLGRDKTAFTLIELLIVVAIIAILAGMLLPALNKARAKAQSAKCVSNLKQLSTAFSMYQGDSNGFYPPVCRAAFGGSAANRNPYGWTLYNGGYMKNSKIMYCPVIQSIFAPDKWKNTAYNKPNFGEYPDSAYNSVTYAYNGWFGGYIDWNGTCKLTLNGKVRTPSAKPVLFDSISGDAADGYEGTAYFYTFESNGLWSGMASPHGSPNPASRRMGYTNIQYADGHVSARIKAPLAEVWIVGSNSAMRAFQPNK